MRLWAVLVFMLLYFAARAVFTTPARPGRPGRAPDAPVTTPVRPPRGGRR